MANRKTRPFRFNTRSVVDALDGGQVSPGGCKALTNLIFDPSNPFALACRPAALKTYNFSGITTPGFVSVAYVVGDIAYGMIGSGAVSGYDQPFAYNLVTNTLITVSGTQTSSTLPLTQSSSGEWTPPTMSLVGVLLYVTHPGFVGGGSAFFGWFDTTNPAAPVWHSGNTGTTPLPSVPKAVQQFNNRAWFALGNTVAFTDTLATTISSANNFLSLEDIEEITALSPLAMSTSVQGGIQSLVAFGEFAITLITGDDAFGNLATNTISTSVGTVAGRAVASTDRGLMFPAKDGIRLLTLSGSLDPPNPDLKIPFVYALDASRMSAEYNNNIYRITVQNGHVNGNPKQEYWFDFRMNGWTGPHSFTQDMIVPYGNSFIAFSSDITPALFTSDVVQIGTSTFVENGSQLTWTFQTAPLEDDGGLFEGSATLAVVDMQLPHVAQTYTFIASDVDNGVLSVATIATSATGAIWNGFTWNGGTWTATSYGFERYNIPWTNPLVFSRLVLQINGSSLLNFKLSKITVGNESMQYVRAL